MRSEQAFSWWEVVGGLWRARRNAACGSRFCKRGCVLRALPSDAYARRVGRRGDRANVRPSCAGSRPRSLRFVAMKTLRVLVLTLVFALVAALAAGCGSSSSGSDGADDPAAVVPANAVLYAEATIHPSGKVRDDAEAALRKILKTNDPDAKIASALQGASKGSGDLNFKDDVEPWLGDRVGAAVTGLHGGNDADYVIVLASTNDGK